MEFRCSSLRCQCQRWRRESATTDFGMLTGPHEEAFAADEWTTGRIAIDISQIADGVIRYAKGWYNLVLSRRLRIDTSTMRSVYTLSDKVYLLYLADETRVVPRLMNFMNDSADKSL